MSDAYLHQTLSQQQSLAPQMRKSLEILQAGTLELSQLITQALETNPVLEETPTSLSIDELPGKDDAPTLARLNDTDDDWRDRAITDRRSTTWTADDEERRQHFHDSIVAPVTLQQHLRQQLDQSMVSEQVRGAAAVLIGNLDSRGFLDLPVGELGRRLGISSGGLSSALELVRSFDPPGVGASDIRESLLLQLARQGAGDSIEYRIVRDHLEDLARKRQPQIARALGTSVERIAEAAERIGRLSPNPGSAFHDSANPHVLPDVVIELNREGLLEARLTGEHLPALRINDFYKDMIGKTGIDAKARQFLRERIRDGRSLIRSIALRQETILAIAHKLIEKQPDFFHKGPRFLRPLTMNEIADELGMHATTVSRAVAGKFIMTPRGLMEMRSFFATGYQTSDGEEVSNGGVREAIQQHIASENPAKPFSDEAIMRALASEGIRVARRTVAKYREQLGILPSHLRKSF